MPIVPYVVLQRRMLRFFKVSKASFIVKVASTQQTVNIKPLKKRVNL